MTRSARHAATRRAPFVLTLIAFAAIDACAQTAAPAQPPVAALEAVTVTGKALSTRKAIAEKRAEPVISDGVSADDIGSIPDFGLGEALQRVPGVSMILNNGRGEAQFMTLRGFNPDYNATLVDGIALPSTETTRRTVSLDVIPSSLLRQVTVYKTFTPEMPGNAIGGITNLKTRSAFDKTGFNLSGRADLSQWQNRPNYRSSSPSGQLEGTVSNTFGADNRFGLLFSGSYFRRVSSSLNTAIDSYSYFTPKGATASADSAVFMPDRLRWLSYDNIRQRKSAFGKFDFDDHEAWRAHVTVGAFQHLNDEDRRAQWLQNAPTAASGVNVILPTSGTVVSGQSQSDYSKFDQNRQIRYGEVGGEYQPRFDRLIDLTANRARGSYRQDARTYTFGTAKSSNLGYQYAYTPGDVPVFTPNNMSYLLNPANYTQSENTTSVETSVNTINTVKLNFAQNLQEGSTGWGFKTGLHYRDVKQAYDYAENKYVPAPGVVIPMSAMGAAAFNVTPYNSNGRTLLLPDPSADQAYFDAHPNSYVPASTNRQNSTQRDFSIQEDVTAGYAMAAYRAASWSSVFGLRYERTRETVNTFVPTPITQTTNYSAATVGQTYANALPSANLTYDVTEALRVRGAASMTVAPASYAQLGQNSSSVVGTAATGFTVSQTLANPNLAPRKSTNFDLSAEWYWSPDSMLSAAVFRKSLRNEIANLTTQTTVGTLVTNTTQAQNVGDASVNGVEFGMMTTRFTALPAPFNQFGATFNATLLGMSPAVITMSNGAQRQMPSLMESPRSTMNASLLWGNGPFSGQLSYNRTGQTLITLSTTNSAQDVYYKAMGTVDARLAYRYDRHLSVVLQGKNIGATRPTRIFGPGQSLLNQEIDNGRAIFLGVSYAM